jgi:hypothetical protein
MIRKSTVKKGIHEEMTVQELAIMMTNSFNTVFDELRLMNSRISNLEKEVVLIKESMVTKYEFKSLLIRTDKIEESICL